MITLVYSVPTCHLNALNLVSYSKRIRKLCKNHKSSRMEIKWLKICFRVYCKNGGTAALWGRLLCMWTLHILRGQMVFIRRTGTPTVHTWHATLRVKSVDTRFTWKLGENQEVASSCAPLNSVTRLKIFSQVPAKDLILAFDSPVFLCAFHYHLVCRDW